MNVSVVKREKPYRLPEVGEVFTVIHEMKKVRGPCIRIDDEQGNNIEDKSFSLNDNDLIFSVHLDSGRQEAFFKTRKYTILNPINNGQIFEEK